MHRASGRDIRSDDYPSGDFTESRSAQYLGLTGTDKWGKGENRISEKLTSALPRSSIIQFSSFIKSA
jgi:hypothetical protein